MKVKVTVELIHDNGKKPVRCVSTEYRGLTVERAVRLAKIKTAALKEPRRA